MHDVPYSIQDKEHLLLLAIGYWVMAVWGLLTSLGFAGYFLFIGLMSRGVAAEVADIPEMEMVSSIMPLFLFLGIIALVFGLIGAALKVAAGFFLKKRKGYGFILAIAGLTCMSLPFGTILGIYTFVVLMRPQVSRAFKTGEAPVDMRVPMVPRNAAE